MASGLIRLKWKSPAPLSQSYMTEIWNWNCCIIIFLTESKKVRDSLECELNISYGMSESQKLDIFGANTLPPGQFWQTFTNLTSCVDNAHIQQTDSLNFWKILFMLIVHWNFCISITHSDNRQIYLLCVNKCTSLHGSSVISINTPVLYQ